MLGWSSIASIVLLQINEEIGEKISSLHSVLFTRTCPPMLVPKYLSNFFSIVPPNTVIWICPRKLFSTALYSAAEIFLDTESNRREELFIGLFSDLWDSCHLFFAFLPYFIRDQLLKCGCTGVVYFGADPNSSCFFSYLMVVDYVFALHRNLERFLSACWCGFILPIPFLLVSSHLLLHPSRLPDTSCLQLR